MLHEAWLWCLCKTRRACPNGRKEGRNIPCLLRRWVRGRLPMHQISKWGLRPQSQCRMPPATDPDGPAALNPMLVALSRSNISAHTRANGRERIQIVIVHAHTVVPQKSSSNPAFPCSALRIKALEASPSSPMKFIDSLYRDADRKVVHIGGILPWPSAKHVVLPNQSLGIGRQTYLIFVSAPFAASAGARAAAPSAPRRLRLRLRNKREHATGH
jgi:hypothetical protein